MESYSNRMKGRVGYASVILALGGVFAVIQGLLAVYKPELFVTTAAFWFSDLETWGWIIFGLGAASIVAAAAVAGGSEPGRLFGVLVASLLAVGQLLFAQAYPLWSLVMVGISIVAIHGLFTHGEERVVAALGSSRDVGETGEVGATGAAGAGEGPSDVTDMGARRAA
jgi:hypothetical protein